MPTVILINAKDKKVEVVEATDLTALQTLVGGYLERVAYVKKLGASSLCVDEEGLLKEPTFGFSIDGFCFAGNGLIGTLGKTNTKVTPADLVGRLAWHSR